MASRWKGEGREGGLKDRWMNGRECECHTGRFPTDSTLPDNVDSPKGTGGKAEGGRVPASDSGRVSSQGRVIGGQEGIFPRIAASMSHIAPNAPSFEADPFREPGSTHPAPRGCPKTCGKP